MQKFIVPQATVLRDFTDSTYPQGSFALPRLLREREVRVNGAKVGENVPLSAGDEVAYYTTPAEEARPFYTEVYRDENVLIADKFAGVNTEALAAHLARTCGARAVHRLDRNTCGLLAFALNGEAERALLAAFRGRTVRKVYEAVCLHPFAQKRASLHAYLTKDAKKAEVRVFSQPRAGALPIATEYEVLEERGGLARVQIVLHSGRTHQIRAHMAFIGHPVLGDEKYGDEAANRRYGVKRQLLVAKRLSFACEGALASLGGREFVSAFSAEFPAPKG